MFMKRWKIEQIVVHPHNAILIMRVKKNKPLKLATTRMNSKNIRWNERIQTLRIRTVGFNLYEIVERAI